MHWFTLLYFGGFVLVIVIGAFEPEDAEFSPSMALTSLLLVSLLFRIFIRAHS